MVIAALTFIVVTAAALPVFAGDFLLFPEPKKALSAETLPYSQMLHTGVENDTFYLRGRFGVDFHIAGYRFGETGGKDMLFGINAAANINMRPTGDMRFPVDNFYALLALHLSGTLSEKLSWRLYPIHHVSAHLADGHPGLAEEKIRSVSTEMVRGEVYYKPLGESLELGAGFGYHYHVCAQEDLVYRADLSILLKPPSPYRILDGELSPYALVRLENVRQGGDCFGTTASAGAILRKSGRGFGLSIIYFDKLHGGYYFDKYEKGAGAEYMFLF
ncbi:hypothetical protein R80B4_03104 [Fibrobacteres bacterium R8-0-B4]